MDKIYKCTVVVTFRVKEGYEEHLAYDSSIIGFKLPNGRKVRPIIGLEVESKNGSKYTTHSQESEFAKLGFEDLDYLVADFEEDEIQSEQYENDEYENMPLEKIPAMLEPGFESTKKIIECRLREGK